MEGPEAVACDAASVRVAVRVRPLITRELLQGSRPCISADGPCVTVGRDRRFTFDHAFGPSDRQEQVYDEVVAPLVESCFDGFNVTVLAYGQTGSGKTFTMGTGECGQEEQLGMAPRVVRHVFQGIAARKEQAAFYVRAQFLEIYNEDVRDLLLPPAEQAVQWVSREQSHSIGGGGGGGITLRDAGDGTIMVIGASEEPAECAEDLLELLERGMAARATSSTCANEQSSRSHAILTIIVEQHMLLSASVDSTSSAGGGGLGAGSGRAASSSDVLLGSGGTVAAAGEIRTAKLHLVDLAGSERTKQLRSSAQGARFRETVNINQGLLALGNVISALGDERRRGSHVPYRESKLTRLLQDSLGGNSRTAMIACVSPADEVLEETLNTLKYANRARNIRNKPVVNRTLPPSPVSPLHGAVAEVQLEVLQQLAAQLPDGSLARSLPLAELRALDGADPAACLQVLTRMRSALAAGGAGGSRAESLELRLGAGGPVRLVGSSVGGGSGEDVEALVAGCSRAIAGILQGLAEMEAQGHVDREAREHILRSLDASTLGLLPGVRGTGPPSASGSLSTTPRDPSLDLDASVAERPAEGQAKVQAAGTERERALEERVRTLETELASCRGQLQEAQEDLQRDEIIFADKMKDLQDARAAGEDAQRRLAEAEERHAMEVEELRRQLAATQQQLRRQQHVIRTMAPGPSRSSSRTGSRPPSETGMAPATRRLSEPNAATAAGPQGGAAAAAAAEGDEGAAEDGERGGEEDEVLYDEELLSYISETDYAEQPGGREVLESDAALREELAEVLREKAGAEEERAVLERAALAQRSSFDLARAALEEQLSALSGSIAAQQQQLEAAQAAEREARELAAQWQERAEELEAAIEAREAALAQLRDELEAVESGAARTSEEREALRQQYERRIAAVVAQVSVLQRQLQQHAAASSGGMAGGERRDWQQPSTTAMEAELVRLRSQQADLKKQLSERVSRYGRDSAARVKELAALRKAAAAARSRMQALEAENRAQRLLLRDKQREIVTAQQRLRESQRASISGGGGGGGPRRSTSPGCRGYMARSGGGGSLRSSLEGFNVPTPRDLRGSQCLDGGLGAGSRPAGPVRTRSPGRAWSPGRVRPLGAGAASRSGGTAASLERSEMAEATNHAIAGTAKEAAQPRRESQDGPHGPQPQPEAPQPLTGEQQQELRGWAESLLETVAEAAGVTARCEVLASRQAELRSRRELLLREQAQLALRAQRRRDALAAAVAACDAELAELVGRIPSPRYDTPPASAPGTPREAAAEAAGGGNAASGADAAAAGRSRSGGGGFGGSRALLSDEWVALQQRIADVSHGKAELEGRLRSNKLLDDREQQVSDSLDDQLDDLETQVSYIAGELADQRSALALLSRRRQQLEARQEGMPAEGLRLALAAAAEAVEQRAFQVRQLEAALAAKEAGAARREAALQARLRESLVSLSQHLASMEAASPGSSASLKSSELRTLLGVYLDVDLDREQGLTAGRQHSPEHAAPAPRSASTDVPSAAATGCSAPSVAHVAAKGHDEPPAQTAAEGPPAPSSHLLAATAPAPRHEVSRMANTASDLVASSSLEALPIPPACGDSICLGPGGWGKQPPMGQGQDRAQRQVAGGCDEGIDLSLQTLPVRPLATAGHAPPAAVPPRPQERSGGLRLSWDSEQCDAQTAFAAHAKPQEQPPQAQQPMRRSATPPPSGILRRAGSFDSVNSSGSMSSKRVTWSAVLATDPEPTPSGAAASSQLPPGVPLGPCGQGRGRERSILDRAPAALRPAGQVMGAGPRADTCNDVHVHADRSGGDARGSGDGGKSESQSGEQTTASIWSGAAHSNRDAGATRQDLPPLPLPSRPHPASTSVGGEADDTAAAADTARASDGRSSGDNGDGAKPEVRSHNPWQSARASKSRDPEAGAADTGARRRPGSEACQRSTKQQASLSGGGGDGDGGDDLLQHQDSDLTISLSEEGSTISLHNRPSDAGPLPAPSSQRPWHQPLSHRDAPQGVPAAVPPGRETGAMPAPLGAQTDGRRPTNSAVLSNASEEFGVESFRRGTQSCYQHTYNTLRGRVGKTAAIDGNPNLDDAELEEQVRMLEQAVAAAHSQLRGRAQEPGVSAVARVSAMPQQTAHPFKGTAAPGSARESRVSSADWAVSCGGSARESVEVPAGQGAKGMADPEYPLRLSSEEEERAAGEAGAPGGSNSLPAPARSSSPTMQHYGRMQRGTPRPAAAPGPFTNPAPALGALAEALLPYKAHLRRSGAAPAGGGAAAGGSGSGPALAGRPATPDGRRHTGASLRAGFASPQVHAPAQQAPQQQQQRPLGPGAWPTSASTDGAKPAAARQLYQQHPSQQQPWRQLPVGGQGRDGAGALAGRGEVDERPIVLMREARQRGFLA